VEPEPYCETAQPSVPARPVTGPGTPVADCVHCGEPTEHPADLPGALLCPLCEWQQAQRGACSG
jgi:hypothetical protein